ncbi:amidohydrolase [Treponema sp. OttesenSCG-928-L16]|nr:amidohydrolase [Treponema sp. OttesenSCG-928-L16]
MKCVDTACFYGRWPFRAWGDTDVSDMLEKASGNNVNSLMISSVQSIFYQDSFEGEMELHSALAGYKNVYHIATVNPMMPGWEADLEKEVREYGIRAVKVFPGYHKYSLFAPEMERLCQVLEGYDLPLILCLRVEDERVAYMVLQQTVPIDAVGLFMCSHRNLKLVLSNISFGEVMSSKPNIISRDKIWIDTAGFKFISFPLEKLLVHFSEDQFLFGSQFPLYIQKGIMNEVTEDDLPEETKEKILWSNAAKLFRLD